MQFLEQHFWSVWPLLETDLVRELHQKYRIAGSERVKFELIENSTIEES